MPSWDVFKKRNPWIVEVLSKAPSKKFTATKDAAHLIAAIDQQSELTSRLNYFAARVKEEIEELQHDITRYYEEINEINSYRRELTAIENQLDKALLELRTLRKSHTIRRLVNNEVADSLTQQAVQVASVYAQTKTQPEVIRRMDMISDELESTLQLIAQAGAALPQKKEESEQKSEESGGE